MTVAGLLSQTQEARDFTWQELVKITAMYLHKPIPTNDECDFILWELTCFPMGSRDQVLVDVACALEGVGVIVENNRRGAA